jgi:hypothetical protein
MVQKLQGDEATTLKSAAVKAELERFVRPEIPAERPSEPETKLCWTASGRRASQLVIVKPE